MAIMGVQYWVSRVASKLWMSKSGQHVHKSSRVGDSWTIEPAQEVPLGFRQTSDGSCRPHSVCGYTDCGARKLSQDGHEAGMGAPGRLLPPWRCGQSGSCA